MTPTRARLQDDERGQTAIAFVLLLLVVVLFFALAFDAGIWFFDHRTAQNQAEAAALAAALELPAADTTEALARGNDWLVRNGFPACGAACFAFTDSNSDGNYDTVRAVVARQSPSFFGKLSGIDYANISGAATATAGHAEASNVMPWGIVPPDPDCGPTAGRDCVGDYNGDGDYNDQGDCNDVFLNCPWGLSLDRLWAFKTGGGGNTGIVDLCGNGAVGYRDCIEGETVSGVYASGDTVVTGLQGGNLGVNTANALAVRYPSSTWAACDVVSDPDWVSGYDKDGKDEGYAKFVDPLTPGCETRLVVVPILRSMPPQGGGSTPIEILGVATFGIAKWNRTNAEDAWGTTTKECTPQQGGQPPPNEYQCGVVWGYLYKDVQPPNFLLQQIGGNNPLAPILVVLID